MVPLALLFSLGTVARKARSAVRESQCRGNLCWIAVHLLNFRETYGHFPAAASPDAGSSHAMSWRVRLNHYIGPSYVTAPAPAYHASQRWNSAANLRVSRVMPPWLSCPNTQPDSARFANYVALIDRGVSSFAKADAILPGRPEAAGAILVVEYPASDIPWTEPRDLDVKDLDRLSRGVDLSGLGVIFADGHRETLTLPELRRRLDAGTRSGRINDDRP
jgi:hypothetical protein